jgi:hypothetical protein
MDGIEDRCMHATGGTGVHKTGGQFSWKLVSFAENCLDEIIIVIEFWKMIETTTSLYDEFW